MEVGVNMYSDLGTRREVNLILWPSPPPVLAGYGFGLTSRTNLEL